jgi:hypothetical protein
VPSFSRAADIDIFDRRHFFLIFSRPLGFWLRRYSEMIANLSLFNTESALGVLLVLISFCPSIELYLKFCLMRDLLSFIEGPIQDLLVFWVLLNDAYRF